MVFIHNGHAGIANLSSEGVAQNDELHQGKDHGRDHERGRAEKLAHLALDDGKHAVHGRIPGRSGMTKPKAFTCSSRSWRPV